MTTEQQPADQGQGVGELLPCPFCGNAHPKRVSSTNSLPPIYRIFCGDVTVCGATVEGRTMRRAEMVWNRRHTPSKGPA